MVAESESLTGKTEKQGASSPNWCILGTKGYLGTSPPNFQGRRDLESIPVPPIIVIAVQRSGCNSPKHYGLEKCEKYDWSRKPI